MSYTPRATATAQPTMIVMGKAISRQIPEPRSIRIVTAASVTAPTTIPAIGDSPAGTSSSLAMTIGMAAADITMKDTPEDDGRDDSS